MFNKCDGVYMPSPFKCDGVYMPSHFRCDGVYIPSHFRCDGVHMPSHLKYDGVKNKNPRFQKHYLLILYQCMTAGPLTKL